VIIDVVCIQFEAKPSISYGFAQLHILEEALRTPISEDRDFASLVFAVCKFIDLALTVQTPELQTYVF
jgi:hypothetical protein